MMLILLAAVSAHVAPPRVDRSRPQTEAESVLDRQRRQPPRTGPAAGLSAEEASVVMAQYLASIGKRLPDPGGTAGQRP